MNARNFLMSSALVLAATLWGEDAGRAKPRHPGPADGQESIAKAEPQVDGDAAYKANCTRCHLAPEKFSPRKTATIMMHMRARANLTAAETEAILRFLTE